MCSNYRWTGHVGLPEKLIFPYHEMSQLQVLQSTVQIPAIGHTVTSAAKGQLGDV